MDAHASCCALAFLWAYPCTERMVAMTMIIVTDTGLMSENTASAPYFSSAIWSISSCKRASARVASTARQVSITLCLTVRESVQLGMTPHTITRCANALPTRFEPHRTYPTTPSSTHSWGRTDVHTNLDTAKNMRQDLGHHGSTRSQALGGCGCA